MYEAAPEALDPRQSQISMLYDDIAHIQDAMAGMMPPKDEGVQPVLEEDELEYGDAETIAETLVVPTIKQGRWDTICTVTPLPVTNIDNF